MHYIDLLGRVYETKIELAEKQPQGGEGGGEEGSVQGLEVEAAIKVNP